MSRQQIGKILINDKELFKLLRKEMSYASFRRRYELSTELENTLLADSMIRIINRTDRVMSKREELKFIKKYK